MLGRGDGNHCMACGMRLRQMLHPWYRCIGCGGMQLLACTEVQGKLPAPVLYVPPLITIVS
jgi:hypothetical protein